MKTVSTKKGQLNEDLKALIIIIRCNFIIHLRRVEADQKASLTEEQIEYWRRVFVKQLVSLFQQRTESDLLDLSLESEELADRFYIILSLI